MNDLENKPANPAPGADQNESLQLQLTLQLLALVLMAATLAFYFYVQQHRSRFDLKVIKPPAMQIIADFERSQPNVNAFVAKLSDYGKTHPDFAPIMQKYAIPTNITAAAAPVPKPAAPAPAAPAPKK